MNSEMETVKCNLKTLRSKVKVVRGKITNQWTLKTEQSRWFERILL